MIAANIGRDPACVLDLLLACALGARQRLLRGQRVRAGSAPADAGGRARAPATGGRRILCHALAHLDAYLAACQLGITIASIGLGVVGESAFEELLGPLFGSEAKLAGIALAAALAFAVITVLHVVVGELAPKSVAISRTTETALRAAPPMRVFYMATKPLVDAFNGLGNLLLRPFGRPPAREVGHAPHSEGELLELLAQSREHGLIQHEEQEIAERGFAFADRRAGDVMRPRDEIDFLVVDVGFQWAARHAVRSRHTRLPVCERSLGLDAPLGLVHAHDLLAAAIDKRTVELRELLGRLHASTSASRSPCCSGGCATNAARWCLSQTTAAPTVRTTRHARGSARTARR